MLKEANIRELLSDDLRETEIEVFSCVESTNTTAREHMRNNNPALYCCIASEQTQGRGQHGKNFYSPAGSGVYFSIGIPLKEPVLCLNGLTPYAALCVQQALSTETGCIAQIKWVNDVYLNDAKVCGILTEVSKPRTEAGFSNAIVGIGINLCPPDAGWPKGLEGRAGSLFKTNSAVDSRCVERIIASVIEQLSKFADLSSSDIRSSYIPVCRTIGRRVQVEMPTETFVGRATGVDHDFGLIVEQERSGRVESIYSAAVSIAELND